MSYNLHTPIVRQHYKNKHKSLQSIKVDSQGVLDRSHCTPAQAPLYSDVPLPAGDCSLWPGSGHFQVTQPPTTLLNYLFQRGDRDDSAMGA